MNKHLKKVKDLLDTRKASIETKLKGSLTEDQKTKLEEVMAQVNEAIAALDSAEAEATMEQVLAVFSQAVEALQVSNDQASQEMQQNVEAKLQALQAKIETSGSKPKKFKATLSLKRLNDAPKTTDGFKPFSAGVDVDAYTPEAEIEDVEIYHPLIGVMQGFDVSSTSKTSIKVRKFAIGSGACAVVANHGVKPEIEMVGSQAVVNVSTYAGVVEGVADEDLEDNAGLEQEIQQEALTNLGEVENTAAIALLEAQGQAYSNASFGTKTSPDERTALAAIVDQVRKALGTRSSQISLALNSSQWAKLNDLRASSSGVPLDINSVLGDVIKITDNSLTTDHFYCWAKKFAKVKIYKAKEADWYKGINVTTANNVVTAVYSEWRTDESSLRVRQREVLYSTDNTTVVKGTLSGVVTALTAS